MCIQNRFLKIQSIQIVSQEFDITTEDFKTLQEHLINLFNYFFNP